MAHVCGMIISPLDTKDFLTTVADLDRGFKSKPLELQHGLILAQAYCYSLKMLQDASSSNSDEFKAATKTIVEQLKEDTHSLLMSASCLALGELGRSGPLPIENEGSKDNLDNKLGLSERLLSIMKTSKLGMRLRERAALALGQICVGDLDFPCRQVVLSGFLEASRV